MSQPTTAQEKVDIAKQKKDVADIAFKAGDIKAALRSYHESLLYLQGLDKNALASLGMAPSNDSGDQKEKTEIDEIIEKIYANMSACHMKNQNWERCLDTAKKALAKNENNYKAMFRKGKALGEIGYFEKAEAVLLELKKKNPADGPIADAEIARLRAIDQEKERANKAKLKGFLKGKTTSE